MPNLGDADGTFVRMMHAVDRSSSLARINGWPLSGAPGSGPMAEQRREQRDTKLVGEVEVCAKALQQRTGLVASTARCPGPGLTHTFGLHPWTGDARGE
jgi:hypothetical protein